MVFAAERLFSVARRPPVLLRLSLAAAAAGAAVLAGVSLLRPAASPHKPTPARIDYELAGHILRVPAAWLRETMDPAGGPVQRLDLAIPWPHAAGGSEKEIVAVTLVPADAALDPVERPAKLYMRFLAPESWPAPGGLVLRRFRAGSPYEGEELYLTPPDGRRFFARCARPAASDVVAPLCTTVMRLAGIDVVLRFGPERLADWPRLRSGAERLMQLMAPPDEPTQAQ
ncbi:hypothetical protein [Chelatococcus composti]|uniref:Uncharacterized protein n=1 Tax=Chelatococcus composti TaxID=1743235 RepID=A0A841KAM4_9HYPH|nr:hypothetical protein [Chelatococcus composti]MBB6166543.1 hypothetical protein [Chelatococcus composti]MBS7734527.1 hypothetical protein [Chelatococcus composti]GGG27540.1 hypothetical protein GCM10008026_04940 [Chelatococcus composti]